MCSGAFYVLPNPSFSKKRDAKNVPDGKIGNIIPLYVTEKHHKIYHFEFAIKSLV